MERPVKLLSLRRSKERKHRRIRKLFATTTICWNILRSVLFEQWTSKMILLLFERVAKIIFYRGFSMGWVWLKTEFPKDKFSEALYTYKEYSSWAQKLVVVASPKLLCTSWIWNASPWSLWWTSAVPSPTDLLISGESWWFMLLIWNKCVSNLGLQ